MALSVSFGTLQSGQSVGTDAPKDDSPFRLAVLGDFSGRSARGEVGDADEIGRRRKGGRSTGGASTRSSPR